MIELDGTETKARLGANALLAVSLAAAHAAAREPSASRCTRYLAQHLLARPASRSCRCRR